MSTATQDNKNVSPQNSETQSELKKEVSVTEGKKETNTENKSNQKTDKKDTKTSLAKYKKYLYLFFTSSAGLLISYFAYRRFQKRH